MHLHQHTYTQYPWHSDSIYPLPGDWASEADTSIPTLLITASLPPLQTKYKGNLSSPSPTLFLHPSFVNFLFTVLPFVIRSAQLSRWIWHLGTHTAKLACQASVHPIQQLYVIFSSPVLALSISGCNEHLSIFPSAERIFPQLCGRCGWFRGPRLRDHQTRNPTVQCHAFALTNPMG